jgi:hypothetical protein
VGRLGKLNILREKAYERASIPVPSPIASEPVYVWASSHDNSLSTRSDAFRVLALLLLVRSSHLHRERALSAWLASVRNSSSLGVGNRITDGDKHRYPVGNHGVNRLSIAYIHYPTTTPEWTRKVNRQPGSHKNPYHWASEVRSSSG